MLAPHELKKKTFSKSIKGYAPAEVDDYIDFLIEKYTELYRENNKLENRLKVVVTNLDSIKDEEESIRETLVKSQKLAESIVRDANERADVITGSIKERCDTIIADFRTQLAQEKDEMWLLRTKVLDFKKKIYDLYRGHIEELQGISVNELEDIVLPDENEIVGHIFTDVKTAIQEDIDTAAKKRSEEDLNSADNAVNDAPTKEMTAVHAEDAAESAEPDKPSVEPAEGEDFIDLLEKQE